MGVCETISFPMALEETGIMVELMIEQWSQPDGSIRYLWSIWQGGKRIGIGEGATTAEAAERAGRQWCLQTIAAPPDRVTRL